MAARPDLKTVRAWIEQIFQQRDDLEGEALASLIAQGILRHEKSRRLWIIDVERFPLIDNKPQQDVRVRLANAILTDEIPETRDIMLVSIAEPCGLLGYVLSESALALAPAAHPDAVQPGDHQPHRDRRDPGPGVHPAPVDHQGRLRFAVRAIPAHRRADEPAGHGAKRTRDEDAEQRSLIGVRRKNHWSEKAEGESDDPERSRTETSALQNPLQSSTLPRLSVARCNSIRATLAEWLRCTSGGGFQPEGFSHATP